MACDPYPGTFFIPLQEKQFFINRILGGHWRRFNLTALILPGSHDLIDARIADPGSVMRLNVAKGAPGIF
jgi:hypothetical protein